MKNQLSDLTTLVSSANTSTVFTAAMLAVVAVLFAVTYMMIKITPGRSYS
jgi:hypothetical protein